MKFGEKIIKISNGDYQDFYIDYQFLKDFVKDYHVDFEFFKNAINIEVKKLNAFVLTMKSHPEFTRKDMLLYILYNYIGLFKIIKKYDKLRNKNMRLYFFDLISKEGFYRYFIDSTRRFTSDIRLIVLSLEGVIVKRDNLFGNFVVDLISRLKNVFPDLLDDEDKCDTIWKYLDYDISDKSVMDTSIIMKGDVDDIRNAICDYIINHRELVICNDEKDRRSIINIVRQEWHDVAISKKNVKECGNIRALFEFLKMQGIRIGICTSCERKLVEEVLSMLNIVIKNPELKHTNIKIDLACRPLNRREPFEIDHLICGNDMIPCKPSPDALLRTCNKVQVSPGNSIIVGDSPHDIYAGINARFARTVIVRPSPIETFAVSDATHVVSGIDSLPNLFLDLIEEKERGLC